MSIRPIPTGILVMLTELAVVLSALFLVRQDLQKGKGWARPGKKAAWRRRRAAFLALGALLSACALVPDPVLAASTVNTMFGNLNTLLESIVSLIGETILLWNCVELGTSMGGRESTMISGALRGMGGGIVMLLAGTIVATIKGSS